MRPKVCVSKSYRSSEQLSFSLSLSPPSPFSSSLFYFTRLRQVKEKEEKKEKSRRVHSSPRPRFHSFPPFIELLTSLYYIFGPRDQTPVVHINVYLINPHLAPSCHPSETISSLPNLVDTISPFWITFTLYRIISFWGLREQSYGIRDLRHRRLYIFLRNIIQWNIFVSLF